MIVRAKKKIRKSTDHDPSGKTRPGSFLDHLVIGWREWVALPSLNILKIKAKIDTGARTSALHAYDIEEYYENKILKVRFKVHPGQKDTQRVVRAEAEVFEKRLVRDSGGRESLRPVILTTLSVGGLSWEIELTLVNRDQMGFRMLLGREAVRGHLLVNPGGSYILGGRRKSKKPKSSHARIKS